MLKLVPVAPALSLPLILRVIEERGGVGQCLPRTELQDPSQCSGSLGTPYQGVHLDPKSWWEGKVLPLNTVEAPVAPGGLATPAHWCLCHQQ
jgi:hypothetical protein